MPVQILIHLTCAGKGLSRGKSLAVSASLHLTAVWKGGKGAEDSGTDWKVGDDFSEEML